MRNQFDATEALEQRVMLAGNFGEVTSFTKISDTEGDFTVPLDFLNTGDGFGIGVTSLGDLDGDGISDMAVGAWDDDDGGTDRGAVHVLFMNTDGRVKSHQKISDTEGNFTADLDDNDEFGVRLTNLGDLDGDGITDLAVGASSDDDSAENRGAVYVLFLNSDGTVKAHQKISETVGNFNAVLGGGFGISLANLGDLDGDGITDMAVGDFGDDDGGNDRGAVYVLFMNTDGTVKSHQKISDTEGNFSAALDDGDDFGIGVANLGDLDGDAITDLAVGASSDNDGGLNRGAVYVLFLNADGTVKSHQKISDTEGNFSATLDDGDAFGIDLTSLGDLNGDGITDLAVGAFDDDDDGSDDDGVQNHGAAYVLFLNTDGTVESHQKISDTEGNFSAALDDDDNFGIGVANLGDLDGDGINDLAVGAHQDDDGGNVFPDRNRGAVYVLFLNADGTVKRHQKISDTKGNAARELDDDDLFASSVTPLGDLNGDGITDLAVGAYQDDDGGTDRGAVYILFMNANGTVKEHQKISSTRGNFTGLLDDNDGFGFRLTNVGDLDGDGVTELAVGVIWDDDGGSDIHANRGAVFVLFLNADGTVKSHQKISDTEGNLTVALDNGDGFGISLTNLGDLDGDGIRDLAVGAETDDDGGADRGAVYVLFLNADGTVKSHQKISGTEGNFTATLDDGDQFGVGLTSLGDLDGDGITDLAVGVEQDDDGGADRGAAYILFLNANGTVKAHQKISDTEGDFTAALDNGDAFGVDLTNMGDLDGDRIPDLAVGAFQDDDGGEDRGAVYVLFMNADGTVKSHQKISDTQEEVSKPLQRLNTLASELHTV